MSLALRLRGTGVSSVASRGASIMAPLAVGILFSYNGVTGVTTAMVGLLALQGIVIAVLGLKTARRSLDSNYFAGH